MLSCSSWQQCFLAIWLKCLSLIILLEKQLLSRISVLQLCFASLLVLPPHLLVVNLGFWWNGVSFFLVSLPVILFSLFWHISPTEMDPQVLEAFASWLRLRHGIPGAVLASHPLVLTALSSLNSELLSEASVNERGREGGRVRIGKQFQSCQMQFRAVKGGLSWELMLMEITDAIAKMRASEFSIEASLCSTKLHQRTGYVLQVWKEKFVLYMYIFLCFYFSVVSELIHYTTAGSSGGASVQIPLIQVIVPQVMNLKVQLRDSSKVLC
ncbi:Transportin MOS14 [Vitis vinifera]|uniref:Transportin MOS14 n=1 Tax=Vitis vinifera TaxID=29760 RepID=A0A438KBT7_VITVI|nr:Transportin MOS14 [Vitis vinifera]